MSFTLIEHLSTPSLQVIDLGATGSSAGDLLLIDRPLLDPNTGRTVGTLVVRGTLIRVFDGGDVLLSVDANNILKDCVISTQPAFRFSEIQRGVTVAITGGTGAFARARGTVTLNAVDSDTTKFTYDVLL